MVALSVLSVAISNSSFATSYLCLVLVPFCWGREEKVG